ncbi:MAG TPA: TetR family transcriptional regulator [Actinomycetes bacterium]
MMARTGRRPGSSGTREAILRAATEEFGEHGYDGTSIRNVARRAGVDAALVHHYFGRKQDLFVASLDLPVNPADMAASMLAEDPEAAGERIVGLFVSVWDHGANRQPLMALLRSAVTSEQAAAMLREFATREVFSRVVHRLDRPDAQLRANLVVSQLIGLAMARYIVKVEPLASLSPATLAIAVGPTLQRYLTGDLGRPAP